MNCPICKKPTQKEGNSAWPFCSVRCKTTDLNKWAVGDYFIKGEVVSEDTHANEESTSDED